jgi:hypothetical protein
MEFSSGLQLRVGLASFKPRSVQILAERGSDRVIPHADNV